jgi:hypothetical protein
MGFGFGSKGRKALREGVARADKKRIKRLGRVVKPVNGGRVRAVGRGVSPIDTAIKPVGRAVRGTGGRGGRVGRPVRAINRRTSGADDIFDPL